MSDLKYEANQIIAECLATGILLGDGAISIAIMLARAGQTIPDDPLAWATDGKITIPTAAEFDHAAVALARDIATARVSPKH